jgi:proline iminopeptidase
MVEDVEAVRRAFRLDRLTLLGHSWGGSLAVLYAARYPNRVQRMVLVGPIPPRPNPYFEQYEAGQQARRSGAETTRMSQLDSIVSVAPDPYPACRESNRIYLRGVAATAGAADRIKGDLCAGTPSNLRLTNVLNRQVWTSLWDSADGGGYDWRPLGARVMAPTLVVHGDRDPLPLSGSEEWVQALPTAWLRVIHEAGHYPHAEQPEHFFPAVEAFLASLVSNPRR